MMGKNKHYVEIESWMNVKEIKKKKKKDFMKNLSWFTKKKNNWKKLLCLDDFERKITMQPTMKISFLIRYCSTLASSLEKVKGS